MLWANPLGEHQQVLALTKMHGSRRRLETRLRGLSGLRGRYRCSTMDSFAWIVVRRWRSLARMKSARVLLEEDYEQVCLLAGDLLAETIVARWVARAFPIVVVDEFQDSKGGQLEMIRALSSVAACIVAADDFQDLEGVEQSPAVEWARTKDGCESLTEVHRTSAAGLLEASQALRDGRDVPETGHGFKVLGAPNHNVGASFVAKNLTWWGPCADIAVLSPVRPSSSAFVCDLIARVQAGSIGKPPAGPFSIPWEESQEQECEKFVEEPVALFGFEIYREYRAVNSWYLISLFSCNPEVIEARLICPLPAVPEHIGIARAV